MAIGFAWSSERRFSPLSDLKRFLSAVSLKAGDRNAHIIHAEAHGRVTYIAVCTRTAGLKDSLDTTAETEMTRQTATEGYKILVNNKKPCVLCSQDSERHWRPG